MPTCLRPLRQSAAHISCTLAKPRLLHGTDGSTISSPKYSLLTRAILTQYFLAALFEYPRRPSMDTVEVEFVPNVAEADVEQAPTRMSTIEEQLLEIQTITKRELVEHLRAEYSEFFDGHHSLYHVAYFLSGGHISTGPWANVCAFEEHEPSLEESRQDIAVKSEISAPFLELFGLRKQLVLRKFARQEEAIRHYRWRPDNIERRPD